MNNMHAHMHAYNFIQSMMYRGSIMQSFYYASSLHIHQCMALHNIIHATSTLTCMTL